jgi:Bacterial regulatory helix-turn-helix protein, lysR family
MDVRLLQTFRAVVDHRSVMQSAAAVGLMQAAVSAQIARLEQGLSIPLFACSNERQKPPAEDAEADRILTGMDCLCEAAQQIPTAHQPAIALACASQTSARVGEWLPVAEAEYFAGACGLVASGVDWPVVDPLSASNFRHLGLVTRPFEPAIYYEIAAFCPRHRQPSILRNCSCRC